MPLSQDVLAASTARDAVTTRAALVAAGLAEGYGDRRVRSGQWLRLAPSVYLTGPCAPTDAQLVRATALHVGSGGIVTGLLACRALGLVDVPEERAVDVLVAGRGRRSSSPYVRVQETDRPPPVWTGGGTTYAAPLRALVDGGRRCPDLRSARALVLPAARVLGIGPAELCAEVEAGPQQGSGLVRRAADDVVAGAWSAPEAEAADLLRPAVVAGRLPPFLLNPVLERDGVRVGRPDGWLAGTRICWQVDSRRHHAVAEDFDATLALHDAYAAHGFTVLHVTPRRLRTLRTAWTESVVAAVGADRRRAPGDLRVRPSGPLQRGPLRRPLPCAC